MVNSRSRVGAFNSAVEVATTALESDKSWSTLDEETKGKLLIRQRTYAIGVASSGVRRRRSSPRSMQDHSTPGRIASLQ